jgi:hypothetical protein
MPGLHEGRISDDGVGEGRIGDGGSTEGFHGWIGPWWVAVSVRTRLGDEDLEEELQEEEEVHVHLPARRRGPRQRLISDVRELHQ